VSVSVSYQAASDYWRGRLQRKALASGLGIGSGGGSGRGWSSPLSQGSY
jgi:hypothetical protein